MERTKSGAQLYKRICPWSNLPLVGVIAMARPLLEIEQELLSLPQNERAQLAHRLIVVSTKAQSMMSMRTGAKSSIAVNANSKVERPN